MKTSSSETTFALAERLSQSGSLSATVANSICWHTLDEMSAKMWLWCFSGRSSFKETTLMATHEDKGAKKLIWLPSTAAFGRVSCLKTLHVTWKCNHYWFAQFPWNIYKPEKRFVEFLSRRSWIDMERRLIEGPPGLSSRRIDLRVSSVVCSGTTAYLHAGPYLWKTTWSKKAGRALHMSTHTGGGV